MVTAIWRPSPNFSPAGRGVGDILGIVIHDTECSLAVALATFEKLGGVSAHLVIDADGTVYRCVQDADVAYHVAAFGSKPSLNRNRPNWLPLYNGLYSAVNASTIGIEIVGFAAQGFAPAQYDALGLLVAELCDTYRLERTLVIDAGAAARIVSHGWLQTDRTDPGPLFDWARLRTMLAPSLPADPAHPTQEELMHLTDEQIAEHIAVPIFRAAGHETAADFGITKAWVAEYRAGRYRGDPLSGEEGVPGTNDDIIWQLFQFGVVTYRRSDASFSWTG